jgi:hypothetical protein
MMYGALWDSVREAELDPRQYVELAIKNLPTEKDEMITSSVLGRVSTAMTYYLSEPSASAGGQSGNSPNWPAANAAGSDKIRIVARYPSDPKQILLSGWALGAEKIAGKAALVEFTIGKGKIVLFGFRPQYRGQSLATFPLLFNAISQ